MQVWLSFVPLFSPRGEQGGCHAKDTSNPQGQERSDEIRLGCHKKDDTQDDRHAELHHNPEEWFLQQLLK
jgi:hypothetical protein